MWLQLCFQVLLLYGLPCSSDAKAKRRLTEDTQDECEGQPGYGPGEYIVGYNAFQWYAARNDTNRLYRGWHVVKPLRVVKDCPYKYKLHPGDSITLLISRTEHYGTMGYEISQEYQEGSTQLPRSRLYFAWEKYVDYYREVYGEVGPDCYDSSAWPSSSSSYSWPADTYVTDINEVRRDFYHVENRTNGLYWSDTRRRRNGWYASSWTYGNEQHWDGDNGTLRVVVSAIDLEQLTDLAEDTVFEGEMEWNEWGGSGDFLEDQYNAVKQLYRSACSGRRNGTAWNQPWKGYDYWLNYDWQDENVEDWDRVPYCTWLPEGWKPEWDEHWNNAGGACHMIDGVRCDRDGYVTYLSFTRKGLKGNVDGALNVMTRLERFRASFNQLSGTVPLFLDESTVLREFDIWHNFFSGRVPCLQGPSFHYMDISYNNLDGTLPDCYGDGRHSSTMYIEHNYIQGTYPKAWGELDTVYTLWLKYNELTGTLPDEICNLTKVWSLDLEGNRFEGSIPDRCLWTSVEGSEVLEFSYSWCYYYYYYEDLDPWCWTWSFYYYYAWGAQGWVQADHLKMAHNRFSGPVPRMNEVGKSKWTLLWAEFDFNHNFFDGTIGDQWDRLLSKSRDVIFKFRDNRLSGPLPARLEQWTNIYDQRVEFDFSDNYFRCEPDGRWPDWVQRMVISSWWISHELGKCLPVAHPISVSPSSITEGDAVSVLVEGVDFVARGFQTCRFIKLGGGNVSVDAAALRQQDTLITCQVPLGLEVGNYEVTVSNFREEFATKDLLASLDGLPTLEVKPVEVSSGANAVEATMTLGGVPASSFPQQEDSFLGAVAGYVGVGKPDVQVLERDVPGIAAGRRLQGLDQVSPRVLVTFNETTSNANNVREVIKKLKDAETIKEVVNTAFAANPSFSRVSYVTVHRVGSTNAQTLPGESGSDDELPIIWIIVAAASGAIACGLCGFILFLYHMEKKGQAYFKEQLDDEMPTENSAPPQKIGAAENNNTEGLDI